MNILRHSLGRCLAAVALLATFACGAAPADEGEEADEGALNLSRENIDVEVALLVDFPSRHRDALNHANEPAPEVSSWSLTYVKANDGFEGVVAYGHDPVTRAVRFLVALDAPTRTMTLLDPGTASDAAMLRTADGSGDTTAESEAAKRLYDPATIDWLQHELERMQSQLAALAPGTTRPNNMTAEMGARTECAMRAAVGALSIAAGFTPYALVGFVASATLEAVVANYENVAANGAGAAGTPRSPVASWPRALGSRAHCAPAGWLVSRLRSRRRWALPSSVRAKSSRPSRATKSRRAPTVRPSSITPMAPRRSFAQVASTRCSPRRARSSNRPAAKGFRRDSRQRLDRRPVLGIRGQQW